jgi:hypothetical protein
MYGELAKHKADDTKLKEQLAEVRESSINASLPTNLPTAVIPSMTRKTGEMSCGKTKTKTMTQT